MKLPYLLLTLIFTFNVIAQDNNSAAKTALKEIDAKSYELNEKGAQATKAKDFVQAEDFFRQAVTADPSNSTAIFNLAGAYITNKKENSAINLLNDTIKKYPNDAGLYVRLGDAYFSSEKLSLAKSNYEQAEKIAPNYHSLAKKLASVYSLSGQLNKAIEQYKKINQQNPNDFSSISNLASLYLATNAADQAIAAAKRSLQIKTSSEVYITLASAYEAKKDYQNALIAFQKAKEIGSKQIGIDEKIVGLKKHLKQ